METMIRLREAPYTTGTMMLGDGFEHSPDHRKMAISIGENMYNVFGEDRQLYIPFTAVAENILAALSTLDKIAEEDPTTTYVILGSRILFDAAATKAVTYIKPYYDLPFAPREAYSYKNFIFLPNLDGLFPTAQFVKDVLECIRDKKKLFTYEAVKAEEKKHLFNKLKVLVTSKKESEKTMLENDVYNLDAKRSQLSVQLNATLKEWEDKRRRLEFINMEIDSKEVQRMVNDMKELSEYSTLLDIKIGNETLTFYTDELAILEPKGCTRPLGKYIVRLDMTSCNVTFENIDNKINRSKCGRTGEPIPHPHCGTDGRPCLGNLAGILPELVASNDLLAIWQVLLSFITSYNKADSWGQRAKYWDMYDADGNIVRPPLKCACCGCELDEDPYIDDPDHDEDPEWIECPGCGKIVCYDCSTYIDVEDERYCNDCANDVWCEQCDDYHSFDTEFYYCAECDTRVCDRRVIWNEQYDRSFCCKDCEAVWLQYRWEDYPEEDPDYEPEVEEEEEVDVTADEEVDEDEIQTA